MELGHWSDCGDGREEDRVLDVARFGGGVGYGDAEHRLAVSMFCRFWLGVSAPVWFSSCKSVSAAWERRREDARLEERDPAGKIGCAEDRAVGWRKGDGRGEGSWMLADDSLVLRVGIGWSEPSSLPPLKATFPALPSMIQQQLPALDLSKKNSKFRDFEKEIWIGRRSFFHVPTKENLSDVIKNSGASTNAKSRLRHTHASTDYAITPILKFRL
jgi:hypothetical protein